MADRENTSLGLAYGMRAGIPAARMASIQSELPRSYDLQFKVPHFKSRLFGAPLPAGGIARQWSGLRLVDGWHRLNEARIALVEAEVCKVFYDVRHDPTEAKYRCRFYLDDAALRLCSSCEHLLTFVVYYWGLSPVKGRRKSLLARTLDAAQGSVQPEVRQDVAHVLEKLISSESWTGCTKYRNDWVHNKIPGIDGLNDAVSFGKLDENDLTLMGSVYKSMGRPAPRRGVGITIGIGRDINDLRSTVRGAYGDLFRAYESVAMVLQSDQAANSENLP